MTNFTCQIYSLERDIFAGQASAITLPSKTGQLQRLENHTPLIALLKEGDLITHKEDNSFQTLPIAGGVVAVNNKEVVVLVNFSYGKPTYM